MSTRTVSGLRLVFSVCLLTIALTVSALGQTSEDLTKAQEAFNAGNNLLAKGSPADAIQKYTDAIAIIPTSPLAYVNRGVSYLSLGKNDEALADADKARELLRTDLYSPKFASIAYQVKGVVYQNRGDYQQAIKFFTDSINLDPSDPKGWNHRGNAHRMLDQFEPAIKDYSKAIELDPTNAIFIVNKAATNIRRKEAAAALPDLEQALKLDKTNHLAFYTRGNAKVELKKYDEALDDYDQAIALKNKSEYLYGRARLFSLTNRHDFAIQDNTAAIKLDPNNAIAYGNRALSYVKLGKDLLAIEDIRKAVSLKPDSLSLQYNLGYLLYKTDQLDEAVMEATKVITAAPKWRDAYNLRAAVYSKMGNAAKAKADRDTAAKLPAGNKPPENVTFFDLTVVLPEETSK